MGPARERNFEAEVLQVEGPVLALFLATWCPFCTDFLPLFRAAHDGGVRLAEVDISDESSPLWGAYAIEIVPTLILFHEGGVVGRADGVHMRGLGPEDLERMLELAREKR